MEVTLSRGKALVVGIDEYPGYPLDCCVNDAEAVASVLTFPEYGFETTPLLNGQASRKAILRGLDDLFVKSSEERLLFYFAGHGLSQQHGTYLETPDGDDVEPGIALPLITRLIRSVSRPNLSVFVILDCCHSGAMAIRGRTSRSYLTMREIQETFQGLTEGKVVLSACRPEESAAEDTATKHGIFTYHLLDGLMGNAANNEGRVTASSLYDYVSSCIRNRVSQNTVFRGDITGSLILGCGFDAIERKALDIGTRERVQERSQSLLDSFQREVGAMFTDREVWAKKGYKFACLHLASTVDWFELKEREHPELRNRGTFRDSAREVRMWQSRLSNLTGIQCTPWGIVIEPIGSGTFGTVWKIKDNKDEGRISAFKVFHGNDLYVLEKLARFRRGYEAMNKLSHPHIVKVAHYTKCPIGFFMDFIDGPNLRNFVGCEDQRDQLALMLTVAETVAHAHSRGVVHRDIKPENILVRLEDAKWAPYLTDFDLAWFSSATQVTKEAFGAPFYGAPEQMSKPMSSSARDPRVDVYAFGQLCFYSLTGSDPVPQADNSRVLGEHLSRWANADAAAVILGLYEDMTQQQPKRRTDGFREICDRLHAILLLCDGSLDESISEERFIRETVYALTGTTGDDHTDTFTSLSGGTRVVVEITGIQKKGGTVSVSIGLQRLSQITLSGCDNKTARKRLNEHLDTALKAFPNAKRRSGTQGMYAVHVDIHDIRLTLGGAQELRRLASRAIEAVEWC